MSWLSYFILYVCSVVLRVGCDISECKGWECRLVKRRGGLLQRRQSSWTEDYPPYKTSTLGLPAYLQPPPLNAVDAQRKISSTSEKTDLVAAQQTLQHSLTSGRIVFSVSGIKCRKYGSDSGTFEATILTDRIDIKDPVLEGNKDAQSCYVIRIPGGNSTKFNLVINTTHLLRCGLRDCTGPGTQSALCLTVRFPNVKNLALEEDSLVTIQCLLQPRTMSHKQQIRMLSDNIVASRQQALMLSGGASEIRSSIELYRKASGTDEFTKKVVQNEMLHIGQEVLLRSEIYPHQGWLYSRLSEVRVTKSSSQWSQPGSRASSVNLIDESGCVYDDMRMVCSSGAYSDINNPLVSMLRMKVFLFQGSQVNEDMVISATVTGCLDKHDCSYESCTSTSRHKRSPNAVMNNKTHTSKSYLVYHVISDDVIRATPLVLTLVKHTSLIFVVFVMLCVFLCVLCCLFRPITSDYVTRKYPF